MSRSANPRAALAAGLLATILGLPQPAVAQPAPTVTPAQTNPAATTVDVTAEAHDLLLGVASLDNSVLQEQTDAEVTVTLAADVLFAFDQADLTPQARTLIAEAAQIVTDQATGTARIDGHTDAKGTSAYNQDLSERRAQAVHAVLAEQVTSPVRFAVAGHGETDPVASNTNPDGTDNPDGRARNRRVTITLAT